MTIRLTLTSSISRAMHHNYSQTKTTREMNKKICLLRPRRMEQCKINHRSNHLLDLNRQNNCTYQCSKRMLGRIMRNTPTMTRIKCLRSSRNLIMQGMLKKTSSTRPWISQLHRCLSNQTKWVDRVKRRTTKTWTCKVWPKMVQRHSN